MASNQVARLAPRLYVQLTRQTGRGEPAAETPETAAAYFWRCFHDYLVTLNPLESAVSTWLERRTVLEYGPGDIPGVAMLMVAHGATKVFCADRFPMMGLSEKNISIIRALAKPLQGQARASFDTCFMEPGVIESRFNPDRIEYLVRPSGLSGLNDAVDLVISRAVLEHVNDLTGTFRDMARALRAKGRAVHLVDLKSHGLHRDSPLDFLTWSPSMWNLMHSHKGFPNRWRVNRYRDIVAATNFRLERLEPTGRATGQEIAAVRNQLAAPFSGLSDEDLSWLGFWLVCAK